MTKEFGNWTSGTSGFDTGFSHSHSSSVVASKYKRCYHDHPALSIVVPEDSQTYYPGEYLIYGGNAAQPIHHDCDIYIGLDGSTSGYGKKPWVGDSTVIDTTFYVTDMQAPTDGPQYVQMIKWVCIQLQAGKKIHFGCIGGHGRTGTALAAVVAEMNGRKDAIDYVRKNYCQKAVESTTQVNFLKKFWKVDGYPGAKEGIKHQHGGQAELGWTAPPKKHKQLGGDSYPAKTSFSKSTRVIQMAPSKRSIWG